MFCIYLEDSIPKAASKGHAGRKVAIPEGSAASKLSEPKLAASESAESIPAEIVRLEAGAEPEVVSRNDMEESQARRDAASVLKRR